MATQFANIQVTGTTTSTNVNATNIQSANLITNNITADTVTFDTLTNTSGDMTLLGNTINIGSTSSTVNINGTLNYIESDVLQVKDPLITLNQGGTDTTAIGSGIEITGTSAIKASLKTDANIDFIVSSTNNKLTADKLQCINLNATGNCTLGPLTATTIAGTLTTAAQPNITSVGTLTSLNVTGAISGSSLGGTLTTAAQPNITSVGTLTSLNVTGAISGGSLAGTLTTAAQPNITSVGTLSSLNVSGAVSASTIAGNITTAAQPNITSVGTLSSLNVSGAVSASTIAGNITTAAQPNITSLGTLSNLTVSGGVSTANLDVSGLTNVAKFATGTFIEMAATNNYSYIDFHSQNTTLTDYDARISCAGGSGSSATSGTGNISVSCQSMTVGSNVKFNSFSLPSGAFSTATKILAGTFAIPGTGAGSGYSVSIAFGQTFSGNPYVFCSNDNPSMIPNASGISTTGFTAVGRNTAASSGTANGQWLAIGPA